LTYPGSGEDYLMKVVEAGQIVAAERKKALPEHFYILTTVCGGLGNSMTPPQQYVFTPHNFVKACLENAHFTRDRNLVKRMVHVIRNPLDNVVERFRLERSALNNNVMNSEQQQRQKEQEENNRLAGGDNEVASFKQWCRNQDERFVAEEARVYSRRAIRLAPGVPCHAEFFKYVQWHNNVVAVKNFEEPQMHIIHYGSLRVDFGHVITFLWKFLLLLPAAAKKLKKDELMQKNMLPPFRFQTFLEYYTDEEKNNIGVFLREFASVETWAQLLWYFPAMKGDGTGPM